MMCSSNGHNMKALSHKRSASVLKDQEQNITEKNGAVHLKWPDGVYSAGHNKRPPWKTLVLPNTRKGVIRDT